MNTDERNDERGMMNDERKKNALPFIIHHSSFIIYLNPLICVHRFSSVAISFVCVLFFSSMATATVTSALINKQLDTQQNLQLDTTLPDAMQQIGNQTGVRLEADPSVWDLLPWGEQTYIKANIQNRTLRQGLSAITQKLALEFTLGDESVQVRPIPALRRLGRRATVDELSVLDLMTATPLPLDHPTFRQIITAVNDKLTALKSPFAIDDRAADALADQKINVAGNASMADLLEEICQQTDAAWYPWGKTILIVSKEEQIRSQLNKTLSARYNGVDVSQVLLELFQRADVDFTVDPGVYQKIPAQNRSIQLMLDNASVQQALESISGYTGLVFDITEKGVHVSYQTSDPASTPTTRPKP
jgi:hypothetical protein